MPSASASSLDQSSPDPSESSSKRSSGSGACQWGERALSAERAWLPCARGLLWAHVQRVLALGRFGAGHTSGGLHGVRGCARRGGEAACAVKGTGSVLQHKPRCGREAEREIAHRSASRSTPPPRSRPRPAAGAPWRRRSTCRQRVARAASTAAVPTRPKTHVDRPSAARTEAPPPRPARACPSPR